MSILVVAAHPDDEVLGCGGTIAKFSSQKQDVHILILGEGITSREIETFTDQKKEIRKLKNDAQKSAEIMGAKSISFESFPDNMFDSVPLIDLIKKIEFYIDTFRPNTIFTHHGGDLNIDHACTFRAVLTAARPLPESFVKTLVTFETLSSTEYSFGKTGHRFEPNLFIDIQPFLKAKIEAMEAYKGEIRHFPHPRSSKAIKNLAYSRGSTAGLTACEAFSIIRTHSL